ncbi:unnamed protein product [Mytilus coruscus]|uniref:Uncharacterized protein n=1 Tax=Mytilus coruscus TaxID=42192 RepID=A0A6J8A7L3_MYTCO|nr:unnamed protein product [Mytilus coruscus]
MKFPISSFSSALTLYKILSFPHPISQKNTTKASQILDLPNYIAITPNHRHFTTFNYETLCNCDVDRYITCDVSLPIQTIKTSDCIFALLYDNKSVIFHQCNFRLLPELTKSNIFELSPASIILTNAKEVTLKCPNKTSTLPGCQFCIQNIPCSCTLQTSTITYHPRLVNCQEKLQEPSDIKDHLNLKKIAKSAKKDETIFQNLAEPLLDGQITLDSNWPDTNGYLAIASITIGGISFVVLDKMNTRGSRKKRKAATKTTTLEATTRQEETQPPIVPDPVPNHLSTLEGVAVMDPYISYYKSTR